MKCFFSASCHAYFNVQCDFFFYLAHSLSLPDVPLTLFKWDKNDYVRNREWVNWSYLVSVCRLYLFAHCKLFVPMSSFPFDLIQFKRDITIYMAMVCLTTTGKITQRCVQSASTWLSLFSYRKITNRTWFYYRFYPFYKHYFLMFVYHFLRRYAQHTQAPC